MSHKFKTTSALLVASLLLVPQVALAAPVDNPGNARFKFQTNTTFVTFSNSTYSFNDNNDSFDGYLDGAGNFYYLGVAGTTFHNTGFSIGSAQVQSKFTISNITGSVDYSMGSVVDLTFTGTLQFLAPTLGIGLGTPSNCETPSFSVHIHGDISSGTSASFVIPKFSSSSACNGYYTALVNAYTLGGSGALLTFNKWAAFNVDGPGPVAITGS